MTPSPERQALLFQMEEARRQTQLDLIDRQIIRKITAVIPSLGRRRTGYRRGKPPAPEAFLARYRSSLGDHRGTAAGDRCSCPQARAPGGRHRRFPGTTGI